MQSMDSGKQPCAQCGAEFECDFASADKTCWCFAFAELPRDRLNAAATCFCPECLAAELQKSAGSSR